MSMGSMDESHGAIVATKNQRWIAGEVDGSNLLQHEQYVSFS